MSSQSIREMLASPRNDYRNISYWLDQLEEVLPRPRLPGDLDCDVAIIGGGLSGLWTAYYLLRKAPNLKVVVLEAQICGFGAAGRNGGWCNATALGLSPSGMMRNWGEDATRRTILALRDTLDEIKHVLDREAIDAELVRHGVLRVAHGSAEIPSIDRTASTLEKLGLIDGHKRLSESETREWIRMSGVKGALYDPFVEWVNPAKLVRGLADVVEGLGGSIYEHTFVSGWSAGVPHTITTSSHRVRAEHLVVATEAYSLQFAKYRRRVAPMYSFMTITEPLADRQLAEIGWKQRFTLSSQSLTVDYISRTEDGRIAVGGRGAPYKFGSQISDSQDHDNKLHDHLQSLFREYFPQAGQVGFSHSWGGVLGVPRDWIPNVWYDRIKRIGGAMGFTGQGQLISNLSGRIIAGQICEGQCIELALPFVGHQSRNWEPEPLRWIGVRAVQAGLNRTQRRAEQSGRAPTGRSIAEWLSRH